MLREPLNGTARVVPYTKTETRLMSDSTKRDTGDKQPPKGYKAMQGSERVHASDAKLIGPADPKETFQVIICVRRKPGAPPLPDLAYWQATPPGRRKFLLPEEFGAIYGADPAELEQVAKYLRDQGLTIIETSTARRTITASGSVKNIGSAFAVNFGRYKTNKETYRSHEGGAYLPGDVAPLVESVFGLDNRRIGGRNSPPNSDPPVTGQQDAWSIARHYNFPTNAANNQVIGIITVDGGGFTQADITQYFTNLNQLNNTNLQAPTPVVAQGGNNNPGNQQHDFELTQDICVASTVAQGATILVFFETADAAGWIDFVKRASVPKMGDPAVTVMSVSNVISQDDSPNALGLAGFSAMEITSLENAFQEAAVTGVSIFVASGDSGSNYNGVKHSVQWPASNPWVTACGGTTVGFLMNSNQPIDWVWNDSSLVIGDHATGGGISDKYSLPDYQQGIVTQKSLNDQQIRRGVPDIAGNASANSGYELWVDGTNKIQNTNNFLVANGTSIVSPLYAGLAAVINAALGQPVGFLNPTLYAFHNSICRDVNDQVFAGSPIDNGVGASPGYPSGPGWDACTGLGVVDGTALLGVLQGLFAKKTFFILERSTVGKDEVDSLGMNPVITPAYWIAVDGFTPADLQLTQNNLNAPPVRPHITLSVDPGPPPAQVQAIQAMLTVANIDNFAGPVLPLDSQLPNTPQRFLFPFAIAFTGDGGFTPNDASVTLTATLTVNNVPYTSQAQIFLVQKENPFLLDANPSDPEQPLWLSFDLRFFKANQGQSRFGVQGINDPSGAPGFITQVISNLNTPNTNLGGDSFDGLSQDEDQSALEFLQQVNQQYVFNYALARVHLQGTATAQTVRVFFRLFQAQTTSSEFNMMTTYRRFPANGVQYGQKIALLGVQNDQANQPEYVTIPCFASPRINRGALADLTTQTDGPNAHDMVPMPGQTVVRYFGCWLDINQPDLLFPSSPPPNDWDNQMGTWANLPMNNPLLSIPQMIMKAPHQCLIAEIAFDDAPISTNENSGNSDKLAQRNIAWIDGPNPGQDSSRRMPHPFQIRATLFKAEQPDEIMVDWGNTPDGSTASVYLPAVDSAQIIQLANRMYTRHSLRVQDAHTIECPAAGATFIPIPPGTGLNAGLMTIDLPRGIHKGDLYEVMVRQVTTMGSTIKRDQSSGGRVLRWRQVLGGFQISMPISTKHDLLLKEERLLAFFRWIAETVSPNSRWHPIFQRYLKQIAGRVEGFGGDPTKILPSPTGEIPGGESGHEEEIEFTGKVEGIIYDHFGDFEGFILELFDGDKRSFVSREHSQWDIVHRASVERLVVTVVTHRFRPHVPLELIVRETP
jgi:hypothetical protein